MTAKSSEAADESGGDGDLEGAGHRSRELVLRLQLRRLVKLLLFDECDDDGEMFETDGDDNDGRRRRGFEDDTCG